MTTSFDTTRPVGPGRTVWSIRDGVLLRYTWNDSAWGSRIEEDVSRIQDWRLCAHLQRAYEHGMEDQQEIVRRALGISGGPR